jgi:hypothetical protein
LVDSRTKATTFFHQAGATESAAQDAINGKAAIYRYHSSWPLLYNIDGHATYVSVLMDGANNYKGIGVASVANRAIVEIGTGPDALREALRLYGIALRTQMMGSAPSLVGNEVTLDGVVERIASEILSGQTVYYIRLREVPDQIITVSGGLNPVVPITQAGDRMSLTVGASREGVASAIKVVNHAITLRVSPEQNASDRRHEAVDRDVKIGIANQNANASWNALTPDQRQQFLQKQ